MGLGSKIKNALHGDEQAPKKSYEGEQPPGAFPSDSTTASNTKHNTPGTTGTTGSHTTGGYAGGTTGTTGTTGTHTSNTTTGYDDPDGVHGPHGKRTLNKADPRVDSDRDHRGAPGSGLTGSNTAHGTHGTTTGVGMTGSNNPYTGSATTGYDDPDGVHGPHGGRAANKMDPRVDSDRDHRGAPGSGLTGSNTYGTNTGPGYTEGGLHSNPHGGATGGVAGARTTGYDDPDGVHGPHAGRAANKMDPRVDSDRDHRGAPGAGLTGTHRPTDSGVDVGHNKPYPGENLRKSQDPYWGDVGRDGHNVTGTHGAQGTTGTLNKDLPLRPNDSSIGRGGPQAVGGGTYNAAGTHHHDPASSVDRSMEGRDFTHPHQSGTAGVGSAGSDPYSGVHSAAHNPQAALAGGSSSDPYDTRMRDRDMGYERTGHGAAGAGIGAGVGAGAAMAAGQAAHRHHRDDMHESGYGAGNTGAGGLNSSVGHNTSDSRGLSNTHGGVGSGVGRGVGGVDDYSRSSLTGSEPGVPKSSMLDPYNESPTASGIHGSGVHGSGVQGSGMHSNVAGGKGGHYGGRNGSPPFNEGHAGAKVFHTCSRCGEDNDISRYFKKDAVYRMG